MRTRADLQAEFLVDRVHGRKRQKPLLRDRGHEVRELQRDHRIDQLRADVGHQQRPDHDVHGGLEALVRSHPGEHHEHHDHRPQADDECQDVVPEATGVHQHRHFVGGSLDVVALDLVGLNHRGLAGRLVGARSLQAVQGIGHHFGEQEVDGLRVGLLLTAGQVAGDRAPLAQRAVLGVELVDVVDGGRLRLVHTVDGTLDYPAEFLRVERRIDVRLHKVGSVEAAQNTLAVHVQAEHDAVLILRRLFKQGANARAINSVDDERLCRRRTAVAGVHHSAVQGGIVDA